MVFEIPANRLISSEFVKIEVTFQEIVAATLDAPLDQVARLIIAIDEVTGDLSVTEAAYRKFRRVIRNEIDKENLEALDKEIDEDSESRKN